ncbi:MAG: type III-A CRISPR-associated RAMP protein Csm4 [Candidatus Helarchaeota archaeon]
MKIVFLKPLSARRTALRSDTLWGLLCWGIRLVWDETILLETIRLFKDKEPPFLISSAFPYTNEGGKRVLYLPKPCFKPFRLYENEMSPDSMQDYKKYKKIKYIPLPTFKKFISGELEEKDYFLNHQEEWRNIPTLFGKRELIIHNTIDRLTSSSLQIGGLYVSEEFFHHEGEGLFFFLSILKKEYEEILQRLWTFFEHMGMGGDSTIGKNYYQISEENFDGFENISEPRRFVTLSLYYPDYDEREFFDQNSTELWYQVEQRRGRVGGKFFVTPNILKQSVTMFTEGSSFPYLEKTFLGSIPVVKRIPGLSEKYEFIHQYGYAFTVMSKQ